MRLLSHISSKRGVYVKLHLTGRFINKGDPQERGEIKTTMQSGISKIL